MGYSLRKMSKIAAFISELTGHKHSGPYPTIELQIFPCLVEISE